MSHVPPRCRATVRYPAPDLEPPMTFKAEYPTSAPADVRQARCHREHGHPGKHRATIPQQGDPPPGRYAVKGRVFEWV